jgi:putative transposase
VPHTYTSLLFHCVFSTKERRKLIAEEIQPRLWAYMGGIARTNHFKALAVGGIDDHAHILISLPATTPVSKAMQLIKAGSSKWMREEISLEFQSQEAYAAFSIGIAQLDETIRYINNQSAHHKKGLDFQRELAMILAKHGIEPLQE